MPIYEYECDKCGKKFEVFLSCTDKPVKKCRYCDSLKIRKLISNCSFQLKGTGWYVTDYARKDSNGDKKKDTPKSSETKSSSQKTENTKSTEKTAKTEKSSGQAA